MSVKIYNRSGHVISSSSLVENAIIANLNEMYIGSGGVANSTTVNYWGDMDIRSGGVANSTTVNSSGHMYISSGGTANSTTVNDEGFMYISSGGVANRTTVNSGTMFIDSGGTATDITAVAGARFSIAVASNTYIQGTYNGSAFEMKDAYISGYTVNASGDMEIYSGGTADSTTVNSGGYMDISSGGVANSTTMSGGDMYIYSGGVANNTMVNDGMMRISSGGVANNTTVNSSGWMRIYFGGVANSTTVNTNGSMYISSGGKHTGTLQMANGAIVSAYARSIIDFTVADRTVEDDYLINNLSLITGTPTYTITVSAEQEYGTYKLAQGASDFTGSITIGNDTTNYGSITVNSDDFVYNDVTYSLDQVDGNLTLTLSSQNTPPPALPAVSIYNSALEITSQGNVVNDIILSRDNNYFMAVYSGGITNNTEVNSGGQISILNGGVGNNTVVNSSGMMQLTGVANNTELYFDGDMYISSGGSAVNTVNAGGYMHVYNGGTAIDTVLSGKERENYGNYTAHMAVSSGGIANNTDVTHGALFIYDSGVMNNVNMNNDTSLNLSRGGVVNNLTVNPGASVRISSGGTATAIKENGGNVYIDDGADVTFTESIISGITIGKTNRYTTVHSNTIADSIIVDDGELRIYSGGIARNTIVNSSYSIYGSYILYSSGTVYVSSGGIHEGTLQIANGAEVKVLSGGIIDFTVADRTVEDDYLINNLSLITGTPTYTITVSAEQEYGTYNLAQGASDFTGSITIGDGTINYGSITVNGDDFVYNDVIYSLDQVDGNLALTIGSGKDIIPPVMPEISVDITALTTESVTVTATFAEDSVLNEYSFDGVEWFSYSKGIVFENNGKVYFRSTDAAGNVSDSAEYVVDNIVEYAELNGDSSHLSWSKKNPGTTFVSLSDGQKIFEFATEETSIDLFGLENGNYTWQVRSEHSQAVDGNAFEVKSSAEPQTFISESNGVTDFFVGRKNSVWLDKYKAVHNGFINGWTGTKESVSLAGKNRIADVFVGSEDANVLLLTDDANGDALFVEDIYSALGDQARFSQIDEIRAGAGDDIIDMTSQKFEYIGHGVKIYGGDGDDIIWANSGENILYGDAGNDRIVGGSGNDTIIGGIGNDSLHGGGGNDTFIFSGDFGNDVIEQLSGGSITLTFDSENVKWNELANAYTDGTNSVTINSDDCEVIVKYTSIA